MSKHPLQNTFRSLCVAITSLAVLVGTLSNPSLSVAQKPSSDKKERSANDKHTDSKSTSTADEHAEDESAELGVIVGSCPGEGVCVLDTVWGSPADEAGIVHGDYILSLNGTKVSTPKELMDALKKSEVGKTTKVTVWRRGETLTREVMLASKADKPPASHGAWLGVMLAPDPDSKGVMVERVMQSSPAAKAGLRSGDVISKCEDQKVGDAKSLAESIQDKGPGTELQLTVTRDGNEKQIKVALGDRDEAPIRFMRQFMQSPRGNRSDSDNRWDDDSRMGNGQGDSLQMIEETLDEMRQRIRDLENRIRDKKRDDIGDVDDNDVSIRSRIPVEAATVLVVQRGGIGDRDWDGRWNRNRNWNDNDYDWRNRYRSGYRSPLFRSPGYGNYYYRYGGRPYYGNFGRGYGYGYGRGGVRIGNFGVWW